MTKPIWLASEDKKLYYWASEVYHRKISIISIAANRIPLRTRPALILIGCDYLCQYEKCVRNFLISILFPDVPFSFVMPVLLKKRSPLLDYYLLSPLKYLRINKSGANREKSTRKLEEPHQVGLWKRYSSVILQLQQEIIDGHGKIFRVSDLAKRANLSVSHLSTRFKKETGIRLKDYINRIRLCRGLWELISTDKAIKRVALELGYKPESFSLKFRRVFKVCPSQAIEDASAFFSQYRFSRYQDHFDLIEK